MDVLYLLCIAVHPNSGLLSPTTLRKPIYTDAPFVLIERQLGKIKKGVCHDSRRNSIAAISTLPHDLVPKIWKGRFRGQQQKWFLLRFHGRDDDINLDTEHPEFSAWRWLPVDDLVDNIVPFKRDVYEAVVAAFRPHLHPE